MDKEDYSILTYNLGAGVVVLGGWRKEPVSKGVEGWFLQSTILSFRRQLKVVFFFFLRRGM